MTFADIIAGKTPSDQVSALKTRRYCTPEPNVKDLKDQFNPSGHKINDITYRPNKPIYKEIEVGQGLNKKKVKVIDRWEEVNRISLPIQRLIVERAVSFLFANPVVVGCKVASSDEKKVLEAVKRILFDNKIDGFNRKLAREVFTYTEAAEYWYPVEEEEANEDYGFSTKKRIRVAIFSPGKGDKLYPLFDEHGDMIAFSREYKVVDENKKDNVFFETYTDKMILTYKLLESGWVLIDSKAHSLGKIPIVYVSQPLAEWADIQALIERLEKLLSNFAETNDYHASPKIFVNGVIKGFSKKGEAGGIIEAEKDAKAQYLSWDHAPESVKLEIETLLRLIYSMTQTPDISFESVKGLGDVSGIALKLLFMDAHLKGYNKIETFGDAVQRRINLLKAYVSTMNISLKKAARTAVIEPTFSLFMIENDKEKIEMMYTANGGRPLISQKEAARKAALSDDPDADYLQMQKEAEEARTFDVFASGE